MDVTLIFGDDPKLNMTPKTKFSPGEMLANLVAELGQSEYKENIVNSVVLIQVGHSISQLHSCKAYTYARIHFLPPLCHLSIL